jgi:hypothetical protein
MQFYHLSQPDYSSDQEEQIANPIHFIPDIWMPGIICEKCGATWAGSRRLYLTVDNADIRRRLHGKPLIEKFWRELAREVNNHIDSKTPVDLYPGDILGTPKAELLSDQIPDIMQPFPGQIVVTPHVVDKLQQHSISGFRAIPLQLSWAKQFEKPTSEPPLLFELLITGSAWRVHISESDIIACSHCHRTVFPDPERLSVDQSRWDGSDFLVVDRNPNIVIVTERVCSVLSDEGFSNFVCVPI